MILFCAIMSLAAFHDQELAIQERNFKKAAKIQKERIFQADPDERAELSYELALLYLKDQDQEQAFDAFLKTLELTCPKPGIPYDGSDYRRALSIYLDPSFSSPQAMAQKLIKEIVPSLSEENRLLNYFAAIAYANLGKYEEFFRYFYAAYPYYSDHYLAYKTKAILHVKLMERRREEEERSIQRLQVMDHLAKALELEPHDTTIYKLLMSFAPRENKKEWVVRCLNKIICGNIIIPRSDMMFYVQEAVDVNELELARNFVNRAREWYPQSRIVAAVQNYLDACE